MKRVLTVLLALVLVLLALNDAEAYNWSCPNWGDKPTTPIAGDVACLYRGPEQPGQVPENWYADTETGRKDAGTGLSVTQITLRPVDPGVDSVTPSPTQASPAPAPQASAPSTDTSIGISCLIFAGVQTTAIGDGGCKYTGPIIKAPVPAGWLVWYGFPVARWYKPGEEVEFNSASFYPERG